MWTEAQLSPQIKDTIDQLQLQSSKGFGFWIWKPHIISTRLKQIPWGDLLLYVDAGFHLNPRGMPRFREYLGLAHDSESGILGFEYAPPAEIPEGYSAADLTLLDISYTKSEVLEHFGLTPESPLLRSPAIQAGSIFFRKGETALQIVNEWEQLSINEPLLFSDPIDRSAEHLDFIDCRNDQSIFSILAKLSGIELVSAWETWLPKTSEIREFALPNYPLLAYRDLRRTLLGRLRQRTR